MKKFLICLFFVLMAGVSYGFVPEKDSGTDQNELIEFLVENHQHFNEVIEMNSTKAIDDVGIFLNIGVVKSNQATYFSETFLDSNLKNKLEPDIGYLIESINIKESQKSNLHTEAFNSRRARDGLQYV